MYFDRDYYLGILKIAHMASENLTRNHQSLERWPSTMGSKGQGLNHLEYLTSLKLTFSHLKMDGWNTSFLLGVDQFSGAKMLVSGKLKLTRKWHDAFQVRNLRFSKALWNQGSMLVFWRTNCRWIWMFGFNHPPLETKICQNISKTTTFPRVFVSTCFKPPPLSRLFTFLCFFHISSSLPHEFIMLSTRRFVGISRGFPPTFVFTIPKRSPAESPGECNYIEIHKSDDILRSLLPSVRLFAR